ncbi:MAG: shikimate dehydrogenase [Bacteroidetes bacterium]|nr:shikimate dehydrogenase [Bacteroidota bacterium]
MKIKLFGLIGHPLEHSFSESYFKEKFLREGIENCIYKNFEVSSLENFISEIKSSNTQSNYSELEGFNVTMPYKEEIIPYLDFLDKDAKEISAVNVVRIEKKENQKILKGYNTDTFGFEKSLLENLENKNIMALILGSGGASKAVSFTLKKLNIPYKIITRKSLLLDNEINYASLIPTLIETHKLIINTTPLGMLPYLMQMPDIDIEYITNKHIVFDLIYNPEETLLLKMAKTKGAKTINGFDMLCYQAEQSWRIWNAK